MPNNPTRQKTVSSVLLAIVVSNLIVGSFLYAKQANAILVEDPYLISVEITKAAKDSGWQTLKTALDKAYQAMNQGANWISAKLSISADVDKWVQRALKAAWMTLRKKLLNMLVDDIIRWVQGGGKPQFVTDWKGFLSNAASEAGGDFVSKYLGMGFLCKPFDIQLRLVLAGRKSFNERSRCTLADMGQNLQSFYNNFTNGGWATWISVTEPQNNFYGAYFMAMDEKYAVEAAAADAAKNEGIAGAGFLGDKVCKQRLCGDVTGNTWYENNATGWKADQMNPNDLTSCQCEQWETRTPGKIAADSISKAVNVDIDWLISAKEFEEYAAAIIDAAINRVIKDGVAAMTTSGGSSGQSGAGINGPAYVTVNLSPYDDANTNKAVAAALIDQEKLLKENLQKNITEQQTNLGIFNQIKTSQAAALKTLNQFDAANCALPITIADYQKQITANDAVIAQLTNDIADDQSLLNSLSGAVLEMEAYRKAAADYATAYEAWQYSADADQTVLSASENAMWNAKKKALSSTQAALQTQETDFTKLLQAVQSLSMSVVQETNDAMTKRGFGQCGYTQAGTYYATLCNAQAQQISFQTTLSTCLTTWVIQGTASGP